MVSAKLVNELKTSIKNIAIWLSFDFIINPINVLAQLAVIQNEAAYYWATAAPY